MLYKIHESKCNPPGFAEGGILASSMVAFRCCKVVSNVIVEHNPQVYYDYIAERDLALAWRIEPILIGPSC